MIQSIEVTPVVASRERIVRTRPSDAVMDSVAPAEIDVSSVCCGRRTAHSASWSHAWVEGVCTLKARKRIVLSLSRRVLKLFALSRGKRTTFRQRQWPRDGRCEEMGV